MRAAGAIIVLVSCSVFGLSLAGALRTKVNFLRGLVLSLSLLQSELCSAMMQVGEAIDGLCEDTANPTSAFFREVAERFKGGASLREAWEQAAFNCREYGLTSEQCGALSELGGVIGRYEAPKQSELIARTVSYFERSEAEAREEKKRQYKLRAALGVSSGLVLLILTL